MVYGGVVNIGGRWDKCAKANNKPHAGLKIWWFKLQQKKGSKYEHPQMSWLASPHKSGYEPKNRVPSGELT